ncbi:hypothetical protein [Massilia aerilata]|uniref:DUF4942 domain-containing protein n=1 Tax=Massilia aerilata TaxID=453817 RepID=A0ABW0S034_9BURK
MQPQQPPRSSNTLRSGFRNEAELDQLLDLVVTARSRSGSPAAPAPAQAEPAVVEQPKSLNDLFTSYLKYERDIRDLFIAQSKLEKLLFGEDWSPRVDAPSTQGIYRIATSAVTNLIYLAQQRFAPSGGTLEISEHRSLEAVGMQNWRDEYDRHNRRSDEAIVPPVDLDKLWAYLEATYGGDSGIEEAHRQNAKLLMKEFRLDENSELKRTASSVTLIRRLWGTKIDYGNNKGLYEIGYNSRDDLTKLFKGLACAFEWAEMDQLSIELAPARHRMCDYNFAYKPRDRTSFTGLDIVYFTQQWEFKFSHAAAEKLMLYLGTYGQS